MANPNPNPATQEKSQKPGGSTVVVADEKAKLKVGSAKKGIAVIGDDDTVMGFGLVGVKNLVNITKDEESAEIMNAIKELVSMPEIGFILITQQVAERVRAELEKLKYEKSLYPIFIEIPDKTGELAGREDPIKNLIRRAIGMEVIKSG